MICLLLVASVAQQSPPQRIPLDGYLPKHLPTMLVRFPPQEVEAETSCTRGFREIHLTWEIETPQDVLTYQLAEAYGQKAPAPSGDKGIWSLVHLTKHFSDRTVDLWTTAGRQVPFEVPGSDSKAFQMVDTDTYTRVEMSERCLPLGALPKDWPEKARKEIPLPANAPRLPLAGFHSKPDSLEYTPADGGYTGWWFVHEPIETAHARWTAELEKAGSWDIHREVNGAFCRGRDHNSGVLLSFENREIDTFQLPKGWCWVSMSWREK